MTIGERLKKIREFRHMTQKDLGIALGYPEKSATVRIAQYEANTRVPKKDTIIEISKILKCNYQTLFDSGLNNAEDIMETFFWLDESIGCTLNIFPLDSYYAPDDSTVMSGSYNEYNYEGNTQPVAITINYNLVNDFMYEWAIRYREYKSNVITKDEYFEWKINWPDTCDEDGKIEPKINWRKN